MWRDGIRAVSSYLDADTSKYQYHMLNPTPLEFITGYIMEDDVGDRASKRLPQRILNLVDGYISRYCSIISSSERLDLVKQANKLLSVPGEIYTGHLVAE